MFFSRRSSEIAFSSGVMPFSGKGATRRRIDASNTASLTRGTQRVKWVSLPLSASPFPSTLFPFLSISSSLRRSLRVVGHPFRRPSSRDKLKNTASPISILVRSRVLAGVNEISPRQRKFARNYETRSWPVASNRLENQFRRGET